MKSLKKEFTLNFSYVLIYKTTLYYKYERQVTSQTSFNSLRYSTLFCFTLILTSIIIDYYLKLYILVLEILI